ncbi:MAG: hypothetical protein WBP29_05655 [Candidatus Zixiibacteriota bacterium]
MFKIISLLTSIMLSLFIVSCGTGNAGGQESGQAPAEKPAAKTSYVTMPTNTAIAVTLTDSIDTDVQVTGSGFNAKLSRDIIVEGHTLFADGAAARGTLNKVVESGRLKTPAELNFSLTSIRDKSGRWIDVGTNTILEKNDSHTKREVGMIGGGAIIGGIIGKIVDRKGSTGIGAAAGAAAGAGMAAATGKQDIFHGIGTEVTFYSSQSTQVALR